VAPARNVLLITVDQWRGECLSALGHPTVRTPHIDGLAADGVLFRNHYAQAAPCGPSRASLLTGMYLQNHRAVLNGTPLDARFTNIALEARARGYDPVLFGYTDQSPDPRLLQPDDPRLTTYEGVLPGFRAVVHLPEHLRPWAAWLAERGYAVPADARDLYLPVSEAPAAPPIYSAEHTEAAFLTGSILDYLAQRGGEPWFVHAAYIRPHPPFIVPAPYNTMYDPADVPPPVRRATWEEEGAQHPFMRGATSIPLLRGPEDDAGLRQMRATYYGMMTEVDAQLGRLLDGLRDSALLDSTLVVLTSDHGEMLGDHWLTDKLGYFDEAYHIPLVIRDPSAEARASVGRVVERFTENVDVMPTVLDWLGAETPVQCDGRSLLPFLAGDEPDTWRSEAHWEFDFRDPVNRFAEKLLGISIDQCSLNVIRDERYKYVHFTALPPLFFDLRRDPHELEDRSRDPEYAPLVLEYAQKMLSWRMENDERTLTGLFVGPGGLLDARKREAS
jgi:arylsulfatase A-like enzyme